MSIALTCVTDVEQRPTEPRLTSDSVTRRQAAPLREVLDFNPLQVRINAHSKGTVIITDSLHTGFCG